MSDLTALRDDIAEDNPAAARKQARQILECVELLLDQPLLGRAGRIHKTRELVIASTPYTVVYHATADVVTILRVFHQARKWPGKL